MAAFLASTALRFTSADFIFCEISVTASGLTALASLLSFSLTIANKASSTSFITSALKPLTLPSPDCS